MHQRSDAALAGSHPSQLLTLAVGAIDNGLHLASTLAGLAIALWPTRRPVRAA
jgi:hypothetical protein